MATRNIYCGIVFPIEELNRSLFILKDLPSPKGIVFRMRKTTIHNTPFDRGLADIEKIEPLLVWYDKDIGNGGSMTGIINGSLNKELVYVEDPEGPINHEDEERWEFGDVIIHKNFSFSFYDYDVVSKMIDASKTTHVLISGACINYGAFVDIDPTEYNGLAFTFQLEPCNINESGFLEKATNDDPLGIPYVTTGIPCPPLWDPKGDKNEFVKQIESI